MQTLQNNRDSRHLHTAKEWGSQPHKAVCLECIAVLARPVGRRGQGKTPAGQGAGQRQQGIRQPLYCVGDLVDQVQPAAQVHLAHLREALPN